jgi:hypothetical protein
MTDAHPAPSAEHSCDIPEQDLPELVNQLRQLISDARGLALRAVDAAVKSVALMV